MGRRIRIAWDKEGRTGFYVEFKGEDVCFYAKNTCITFSPRKITVEGNVDKIMEYDTPKRKYLYIEFEEPIEPLIVGCRYSSLILFKGFEIRVTIVSDELKYITIITPGLWIYYYAIISNDIIGVELPRKKKVFREEAEREIIVYFT